MNVSDNPSSAHLGRNTRIMMGNHYAEIFVEDSTPEAIFHWTVQRSDKAGVIVIGEQSTYEIARMEAEHHLMRLAAAESAGPLPLLKRGSSA